MGEMPHDRPKRSYGEERKGSAMASPKPQPKSKNILTKFVDNHLEQLSNKDNNNDNEGQQSSQD